MSWARRCRPRGLVSAISGTESRGADITMRLKIVGSAAGGGFPQWNCNYRLSRAARAGVAGVHRRHAIEPRGFGRRARLGSVQRLPRHSPADRARRLNCSRCADAPLRSTPIRAVVLTNADVDHVAGLLSLRERQPFAIYAAAQVLAVLEANSIFNVLDPAIVPRRTLAAGGELEICDADGRETGVTIESFAVPGKVALYLEDSSRPGMPISAPTAAIRSACASRPAMAAVRSSTFPAARGSTRPCARVSTARPACCSTARSTPTTR